LVVIGERVWVAGHDGADKVRPLVCRERSADAAGWDAERNRPHTEFSEASIRPLMDRLGIVYLDIPRLIYRLRYLL
jgi:hypothetical protein